MAKEIFGMMYNATLKESDRYYMWLMLKKIHEATSFEEMGSIDWGVESSYKGTPKTMSLLKDDAKWVKAIIEALDSSFVQLKHIHATIIAYRKPEDHKSHIGLTVAQIHRIIYPATLFL